ncbi:class I lanthipeptide [Chryseobacterium sp. SSA4.19]|uniref:class I lanthipeptide n=1 Tax=Chryseobacterium sp. SSA4.19 TaxID=2919915 RepID=UPI001F4D904B|nr:class I lanthipeptide [Chryseobacterium sp. SSA4.19]MCJ8152509.1 class I lanthipeptide [Chryseobacterium sp. SSA4.19]
MSKKINKKLTLKKEKLTQLSSEDMKTVKAGNAFTSIADCTGWTCTAGSTRSTNLCICGS